MLVIAAKNKYVYERWKRIFTQMIEKDPGCPKLYRLCVIHLYKCDLNLLVSFYFQKLQQHIEENNLLNKGCYSGQPKCRAIDPAVVDLTQIELAMVTRCLIIRCNNDLTQCFGCILCHLAQINNQAYELPLNMATILGKYLEEVIHYIKTGIGLSKQHYSHSTVSGVFGTGQGSVQSMYAWGMIVSRLIDFHNKLSHGAKYTDPTGKLKSIIIGMLSFVYDYNQSITGEKHEEISDLLQQAQQDMQLWNDLV